MMQLPVVLQNFITLFLSTIIESLPFVVLGVIVSVLVALFIQENAIMRFLPKNRFLSHAYFALAGIFIPVCQCGNIPVARRLAMKGFSPSQSLTFLLAAPIVNPITFFTTYFAFSAYPSVAIIRVIVGFLTATIIGIIMSYKKNQSEYLTKSFAAACENEHPHKRSMSHAFDIFQSEFMLIMKMLCIGAVIAAATHEFLPQSFLLTMGQNPLLSIFSMMILGFVLSICSTVDAFFALSYITTFTLGSLIAFLIFAPLVDIKMIALMRTTFRTNIIVKVSLAVAMVSILVGVGYNLFF
jgi:uncharacterized protein